MASRIYPLVVTVPAGTAIATPQVTPWFTEDNTVVSIELEIPPGHNGLTGIRVMKGDTQLIPWGSGSWIVGNDLEHSFSVNDYLPTRDVTIQTYNTGQYPHSFYLRMWVEDYNPPGRLATNPETAALPTGAITSTPDPLSPDAILGPDTASALSSGQLTPSDVTPVITENLTVPPTPQPTGL